MNMGQRHKHADVIIAWAEGKAVQVWDEGEKRWFDVTASFPRFNETWKYRIKPPAKKYRVALLKNDNESYSLSANNQAHADTIEFRKDFIRWLTDWVEYEE